MNASGIHSCACCNAGCNANSLRSTDLRSAVRRTSHVTESAQFSLGSEGWNEIVEQLATALLELATARTQLEAERAERLCAESTLAEAKAKAVGENDELRRETEKLKLEIHKQRDATENSTCITGLLVEKQRQQIALQCEQIAKLREENQRLNEALLVELQQLQVPKVQVTLKVEAQVAPTPAAPAALAPRQCEPNVGDTAHSMSIAFDSAKKTLRHRRNSCVLFTQAAQIDTAKEFWRGKLTSTKRASVVPILFRGFDANYRIWGDTTDMALFLD